MASGKPSWPHGPVSCLEADKDTRDPERRKFGKAGGRGGVWLPLY
jgi:hypothetical protein